ncbi:hypothetical protein A2T98_04870 [Nodularia spumigena CENA596]|uniref:Uncharacterized protein n=1 Tax=Nodularia spumigena CENA596 TaxID=1819295 RepID=A0A166KCW8_NODSP|nr:hypothetical protein [Nodularia spumigena]KZL50927.1 hypothetical protein A2T98_04870 [Nodularia spumigena CENA596]
MDLDLILNELSLRNPAPNEQEAQQRMSELIKTIKAVKAQGVTVSLRTKENFYTTILAPNYPLRRWLNDADQVERIFIKTLATKAPFSTDLVNSEIQDIENNASLSEFRHQGEIAIGLGIAYVMETIAISLLSEEYWDCNRLELEFISLAQDEEIVHELVEIIHASRSTHVQEHADLIQNIQARIYQQVSNGVEIWNRREELFPNLKFCNAVRRQLEDIRTGQLELQPVLKNLFELQKCCKNWNHGYFNLEGYPLEESGESKPTLEKYFKERTFLCPDGKERLFERHIKLRVCNWRIHFFVETTGTVIIGYVGQHLPTVKYPT